MFWLLLSGYFTKTLLLALGAASVILVLYIAIRMDRIDGARVSRRVTPSTVRYWGWLVVEIIKSNIDVARIILSPRPDVSPRLVRVKATQATDLGVVIYANSITLTPGTVTLDIEDDHLLVHAINQDMADGLVNGDMGDRVTRQEAG